MILDHRELRVYVLYRADRDEAARLRGDYTFPDVAAVTNRLHDDIMAVASPALRAEIEAHGEFVCATDSRDALAQYLSDSWVAELVNIRLAQS